MFLNSDFEISRWKASVKVFDFYTNLNELLLTFQLNSLNEDIVLIKGHKAKASQNEIIDGEAHTWIFYKTNNLEFNELYYYY